MEESQSYFENVVTERRKDLDIAIDALRRAIDREDRELGSDGIGTHLDIIKDELLSLT